MTARAKTSRGYLAGWEVTRTETLDQAKALQKHADYLLARLIDYRTRVRRKFQRIDEIDRIIARLKANIRGGAK